jgi:hypothetical protein
MTTSEEIKYGKIEDAHVGLFDDSLLGFSCTLGSDSAGWEVRTEFFGHVYERPKDAKWTVEAQRAQLGAALLEIGRLLSAAKKERVEELVGVPVEVTFCGCMLKEWRILTEVL